MKLELYTDASGAVAGRLTWGTGSPPPPPQAANIEYPPGYFDQQVNMKPGYMPAEPWSGFTYTILRGAGCDTTFRFGIATNELWQPWCALQTSVYSADIQSWGCVLRGNGGSSDGNNCTVQTSGWTRTYPMWLCDACGAFGFGGVCACGQNGCNADMTVTETFDLTYTVSSAADGGITEILSGPDPDTTCSNCTVRLQRQP